MLTGTHKNILIVDGLDCDLALEVMPVDFMSDWLNEEMALDVIKHLSKAFGFVKLLHEAENYKGKLQ